MADTSDSQKEVVVRVLEARKKDVGRSIIRLDSETMNKLGISERDKVEIIGELKKSSVAIAWPAYPQDQDLGIVRLDSRVRRNVGIDIDDEARIRKAKTKVAKSIVLKPHNEKMKKNTRFESFVKRKLLTFPVTKGDLIWISIGINRELIFEVTSLNPENTICVVVAQTLLHIESDDEKFPDEKISNELSNKETISYLKKKIVLLNYLNETGPLKDEISDLKEKINLLNERLDYAMKKIEELISKL